MDTGIAPVERDAAVATVHGDAIRKDASGKSILLYYCDIARCMVLCVWCSIFLHAKAMDSFLSSFSFLTMYFLLYVVRSIYHVGD